MKLRVASSGLFSTWLCSTEHGFLLDAGEGAATAMRGQVQGIRSVFLTHAHTDHISGLPTLLNIRRRQEAGEPIRIFFPANTPKIARLREFLGDLPRTEWIGMRAGAEIDVSPKLFFRSFDTDHIPADAGYGSLGYTLYERRTRRKPEFEGLPPDQMRDRAEAARGRGETFEPSEPYNKALFTYTGDTGPLPETTLRALDRPNVLFHDVTYLADADRESAGHSTLAEAQEAARIAGAGSLVGVHLSTRYLKGWNELMPAHVTPGVTLIRPTGSWQEVDIPLAAVVPAQLDREPSLPLPSHEQAGTVGFAAGIVHG